MSNTHSPLLVFDWDRVVLDCDRYMEAIFEALTKQGLTRTDAERLYRTTKDHNGYSDRGLAAGAARELGRPAEELFGVIDGIMGRMADFIYPDALQFLQEATRTGFECVVLTAGGEELQTKKILHSNLHGHFKDAHIVPVMNADAHKAELLRQLTKTHGHVIFFDDKLSNILPLKDIANVTPVLVNRTGADAAMYPGGIVVRNLSFPLPAQGFAPTKS